MELSKLKIILLLIIFSSSVYGKTVLLLKENVIVKKKAVFLQDISEIKSDNEKLKDFLSSIKLTDLKSGEKTVIHKEDIIKILKNNYIDTRSILVQGEKTVVIREKYRITSTDLEDIIKNYLLKKYPSIKIKRINLPVVNLQSDKKIQTKINISKKTSSYIYLSVDLHTNSQNIKKLKASVNYVKLVDAIFAKRDLIKGEIIKIDDIYKKTVEEKRSYITDQKTVIGAVVKNRIKKDSPIKIHQIQPDYPVKKRSYVRVIYDRNGIKIEIRGLALENGINGQIIKVKNPSTGKVIQCKVVGRDTVLFIGSSSW